MGKNFRMSKDEYSKYVDKMTPNSTLLSDLIKAFLVGGAICCLAQIVLNIWSNMGFEEIDAGTLTSMSMVFIGILLTSLHIYDNIAKFAGAGTLVPITGFANAVSSPAIEFKSEGLVGPGGLASKMFSIAGPVIVYGITTSVLYGIIYWIFTVI